LHGGFDIPALAHDAAFTAPAHISSDASEHRTKPGAPPAHDNGPREKLGARPQVELNAPSPDATRTPVTDESRSPDDDVAPPDLNHRPEDVHPPDSGAADHPAPDEEVLAPSDITDDEPSALPPDLSVESPEEHAGDVEPSGDEAFRDSSIVSEQDAVSRQVFQLLGRGASRPAVKEEGATRITPPRSAAVRAEAVVRPSRGAIASATRSAADDEKIKIETRGTYKKSSQAHTESAQSANGERGAPPGKQNLAAQSEVSAQGSIAASASQAHTRQNTAELSHETQQDDVQPQNGKIGPSLLTTNTTDSQETAAPSEGLSQQRPLRDEIRFDLPGPQEGLDGEGEASPVTKEVAAPPTPTALPPEPTPQPSAPSGAPLPGTSAPAVAGPPPSVDQGNLAPPETASPAPPPAETLSTQPLVVGSLTTGEFAGEKQPLSERVAVTRDEGANDVPTLQVNLTPLTPRATISLSDVPTEIDTNLNSPTSDARSPAAELLAMARSAQVIGPAYDASHFGAWNVSFSTVQKTRFASHIVAGPQIVPEQPGLVLGGLASRVSPDDGAPRETPEPQAAQQPGDQRQAGQGNQSAESMVSDVELVVDRIATTTLELEEMPLPDTPEEDPPASDTDRIASETPTTHIASNTEAVLTAVANVATDFAVASLQVDDATQWLAQSVADLQALNQAVDELLVDLHLVREQLGDLLDGTAMSPAVAATVAGLAAAGLMERRRRRRPPRDEDHENWVWMFSDLLGSPPQ
jgi:hypothetical protein